jgi:hypothetical protein
MSRPLSFPRQVRFGEQALRPPEFSLKLKTWTPEQQAARCNAIFERQMEEAKNAAQQQTSVPNVGLMNAQVGDLQRPLGPKKIAVET